MKKVVKKTVVLGIASEHNIIVDSIQDDETYYIYLVPLSSKKSPVPKGLPIETEFEIILTKDNVDNDDVYELSDNLLQNSNGVVKIILYCSYVPFQEAKFSLQNQDDEEHCYYVEYCLDNDFEPSMLQIDGYIEGAFIPTIQNSKNFIPQLLTSDMDGAPQGLNLAIKSNGKKYFVPFTSNTDYMIGPRIKHNGKVWAPRGDYIVIVTWQGFSSYIAYGIKSDLSATLVFNYVTYLNFSVKRTFLPKFYYSQDSGIYLCMFLESNNLHFDVLKQDGSFSDSLLVVDTSFVYFTETGFLFYDAAASKYKICFLGKKSVKGGWQFAMRVISFSIENDVCKDFSVEEKKLDSTTYSHDVYLKLAKNGGSVQIKRCRLSNGKKWFYYYGIWTGVNGSNIETEHNLKYLIPTSETGSAGIESDMQPSFEDLVYFSDDVLKKFAHKEFVDKTSAGNVYSYTTDTSRLFYFSKTNSLIGFCTEAPDQGDESLLPKDINGKAYDAGDLVSYNLDTGEITLLYKRPSGSSTSGFSSIVGVGKVY